MIQFHRNLITSALILFLSTVWGGTTPGSCFSYSFAFDCKSVWPQSRIWCFGTISTI